MLPKPLRVRRSADFSDTVRNGVRGGTALLVAHVRVPDGEEPAGPVRYGFVVGRPVGPAVVRNRVRRRLRHVAMSCADLVPAGSDVVVRALPASAAADSARLRAELSSALRRSLARRRSAR